MGVLTDYRTSDGGYFRTTFNTGSLMDWRFKIISMKLPLGTFKDLKLYEQGKVKEEL
jgi:hypothetical protein